MRIFLIRIVQFFILLAVLAGFYVLWIMGRPELVDNFYRRFTTDQASSMVIGTSRPAQGIVPGIINERICTDNNPIINHSFAIGPSSYGPNYYSEIQKKIKPNTTNGVFILSVDPWSLATNAENTTDDSLQFYEVVEDMFVGNLSSSSSNPNLEYLYSYWPKRFSVFGNGFKHLINYEGLLELHEDGWLEVSIVLDSAYLANRIRSSTEEYNQKDMYISDTRFYFLKKIITFLQKRGQVFLVRLPVSPGMAGVEAAKFPEFNNKILDLSRGFNVNYFNFIDESGKYQTIDTHHLYKKESAKITNRICDSISIYRN